MTNRVRMHSIIRHNRPWKYYLLRLPLIFLGILLIVYLISVLLNPMAYKQFWQNYFYLIGTSSLGVSAIISLLVPFIIECINENKLFSESEKILKTETNNAKRGLKPSLSGLKSLLPRTEVKTILDKFKENRGILLSGDAGVGKSGVCVELIDESNQYCLLFDTRRLGGVRTKTELANHLGLREDIVNVITRLGKKKFCIVIFDQLDSVCEAPLGRLIVDLAIEIKEIGNVSVIVISRHSEIERILLRSLLEMNFVEIPCDHLHEETVKRILEEHGIMNPSQEVIELAKNILLLDLICSIKEAQGSFDDKELADDISIWEMYIDLFLSREHENSGIDKSIILSNIVALATNGLKSDDRGFWLDDPPSPVQNRFISQGLITKINEDGRRYAFKVEKLQDHLYARDATRRELRKSQVEKEICQYHLRNVFIRMSEFYQRDRSPVYGTFLEEVLSG